MSYTILSVAYPLTHVGPDATGGSEQVLSSLDEQFTEAGHRSLVIAVEGSKVKGELIASPKSATQLNPEVRRWGQRMHRRLLLETLNQYPVDIVHMHALDFHAYLPATSVPTLATLHLPLDWYPESVFTGQRRNLFLNCVSATQHHQGPACDRILPFVRNGVDVSSFEWRKRKEPFVLGLGRICPEKGFHLALDAAKSAGVPMILAGELFPYKEHIAYWNREIAPRLDSERQYIGLANASMKRDLLSRASALLVPSLVAETSSLVTMEALASGTPVIAFNVGAIPELLQNGKTGYLVRSAEEMAIAVRRLGHLEAEACRKAALARCDVKNMGKNYLGLYRRAMKAAVAPSEVGRSTVAAGLSWLAS